MRQAKEMRGKTECQESRMRSTEEKKDEGKKRRKKRQKEENFNTNMCI